MARGGTDNANALMLNGKGRLDTPEGPPMPWEVGWDLESSIQLFLILLKFKVSDWIFGVA